MESIDAAARATALAKLDSGTTVAMAGTGRAGGSAVRPLKLRARTWNVRHRAGLEAGAEGEAGSTREPAAPPVFVRESVEGRDATRSVGVDHERLVGLGPECDPRSIG